MAKANRRSQSGKKTHAIKGEYKIPWKHRRYKSDKWTKDKKKLKQLEDA